MRKASKNANRDLDADLIDRIYAVALEPERFKELADIWHERLNDVENRYYYQPDMSLSKIISHIHRAETLLSLTSHSEQVLPASLSEKMQAETHALIAIDKRGVICGVNDAAINLFGTCDNSSILKLPLEPDVLHVISQEISKMDSGSNYIIPKNLLRSWQTKTAKQLVITLGNYFTGQSNFLLVKAVHFAWPERLTSVIKTAFGLTGAETEIVQSLAEGASLDGLATHRQASIKTVRAQIRSIYTKLSVRNRNEFFRMILGLCTQDVSGQESSSGVFPKLGARTDPPYPRPENRYLLTLPDGRILDYAVFGDPEGRPCLMSHSEFFGDGCTAQMVHYAHSNNLKIIAPARPYNGQSSPYSSNDKNGEIVSADMRYLLNFLNITKVVVWARSMAGSPYGLHFAYTNPKLVAGVLFISPIVPFGARTNEKKLLSFHRLLSSVMYRYPNMLEFLAKSGVAFHNKVGSRKFFKLFAEGRTADQEILKNDNAFAAMVNGAKISGARGHEGYYNDFKWAPKNIEEMFLALKCPVKVMIGNTVPAKSVASIKSVIAGQENFQEIVACGGAQYIFYSHEKLMIDTLCDLWANA